MTNYSNKIFIDMKNDSLVKNYKNTQKINENFLKVKNK